MVCSPLEQAGRERERVKEREKGEPYTRIPDTILVGTQTRARCLHKGLNYSGHGSPVGGHPYVIALEGSCQGRAYRYSHQQEYSQSGGWGREVADSIAEGSGSRRSHHGSMD